MNHFIILFTIFFVLSCSKNKIKNTKSTKSIQHDVLVHDESVPPSITDAESTPASLINAKTADKKPSFLDYPQIYLTEQDLSISFSDLNRRKDISLNLSDKILFFNEKDLAQNKIQKDKSLTLKISSFCSYEKLQDSDKNVNRSVQEIIAKSHQTSFTIAELLPKDILFKDVLDKPFYCSFIFKNQTVNHKHYYNIVQIPIIPFFSSENMYLLSLVTKEKSGQYVPIKPNYIIQSKDIHNILFLNKTYKDMQAYEMFCNNTYVTKFKSESDVQKILLNLISYDAKSLPKGVAKCRIFSINHSVVTGLTDFFLFDFASLNKQRDIIFANQINRPVILNNFKKQNRVYLNSYFDFQYKNTKKYVSNRIKIHVHTQCINRNIRRGSRLREIYIEKDYVLNFRNKFSIMSVTPTENFMLHLKDSLYAYWTEWLGKYRNHETLTLSNLPPNWKRGPQHNMCIYKITLRDSEKLQEMRAFKTFYLKLRWNEESYGASKLPDLKVDLHSEDTRENVTISKIPLVNDWLALKRIKKGEKSKFIRKENKSYISLTEDIYKNKLGSLQIYSPHMDINTKDHQIQKPIEINKTTLMCAANMYDKDNFFIQEYLNSKTTILLQAIFLKENVQKYIRRVKLAHCRLLFYEDEILSYFSQEMKITI